MLSYTRIQIPSKSPNANLAQRYEEHAYILYSASKPEASVSFNPSQGIKKAIDIIHEKSCGRKHEGKAICIMLENKVFHIIYTLKVSLQKPQYVRKQN